MLFAFEKKTSKCPLWYSQGAFRIFIQVSCFRKQSRGPKASPQPSPTAAPVLSIQLAFKRRETPVLIEAFLCLLTTWLWLKVVRTLDFLSRQSPLASTPYSEAFSPHREPVNHRAEMPQKPNREKKNHIYGGTVKKTILCTFCPGQSFFTFSDLHYVSFHKDLQKHTHKGPHKNSHVLFNKPVVSTGVTAPLSSLARSLSSFVQFFI